MTKPSIRLIALDLDGTLLNRANQVTPKTAAALAQAAARGVVVLPATGRPLAWLPGNVLALPGVRYAITSNGAAVVDMGADPLAAVRGCWPGEGETTAEWLLRAPLCAAKALEVYRLLRPLPCTIKAFADGRDVMERRDLPRELARVGEAGRATALQRNTLVENLEDFLAGHRAGIEKYCIFFDDMAAHARAGVLLRQMEGIELVQGARDNWEVTAPGVDKGAALRALAARLGIPMEQTMAVGDSENDLQLLRAAGHAVVMQNGMEAVKAVAEYVTGADCDHDGVAEGLAYFGI